MALKFNKQFNVRRLVRKLAWTLMSLFVGGLFITYFVKAFNGTCSPFYNTLSIIGITVGTSTCSSTGVADANTITSPTLSAGILSVVGILAVGSVLMSEFVTW